MRQHTGLAVLFCYEIIVSFSFIPLIFHFCRYFSKVSRGLECKTFQVRFELWLEISVIELIMKIICIHRDWLYNVVLRRFSILWQVNFRVCNDSCGIKQFIKCQFFTFSILFKLCQINVITYAVADATVSFPFSNLLGKIVPKVHI